MSSINYRRSSAYDTDSDDEDVEMNPNAQETEQSADNQLYANVPPVQDQTRTTSFTVKHMRVLDWAAGHSFPRDKNTLLTLYSLLVDCQQNRSKDRFLIHCL